MKDRKRRECCVCVCVCPSYMLTRMRVKRVREVVQAALNLSIFIIWRAKSKKSVTPTGTDVMSGWKAWMCFSSEVKVRNRMAWSSRGLCHSRYTGLSFSA